MLIKHFNDSTKLIDVKVTDFTDLRHNCWADVGAFTAAMDSTWSLAEAPRVSGGYYAWDSSGIM